MKIPFLQHTLLDEEEELALIEKAQGGCTRSRNKVVEHNLRLAWDFARKLKSKAPMMDKFQCATIGLMKAVEAFDPERGAKFSTYATWRMRATFRDIFNLCNIIHVPPYTGDLTDKTRQQARKASKVTLFCDANVNRGGQSRYERDSVWQSICDMENQESDIERADAKQRVDDLSFNITEKQNLVLTGRLEGKTLNEIGKEMSLTRERVRQIEAAAINSLRKQNGIAHNTASAAPSKRGRCKKELHDVSAKMCYVCGKMAKRKFCSKICRHQWSKRMSGKNAPTMNYREALDLIEIAEAKLPDGLYLSERSKHSACLELSSRHYSTESALNLAASLATGVNAEK